ncbi:protein-L-isoaspartate O-methyltransferase [Candidatus Woesebacteria bacterium RBG_19FT_COMBO_42_9]|uniref:Protein-L-isoaspartate O-methyltransferase n=1 Tax=Candidatus Woesebacteria bacterium RBG_16_42_24 TaxID=1802485 RepID=A0A1F7XL42_9BACT|nr:MAG: protein-L-isoaspartate O-methyltransferase [Candidatus Woesebacteria bacterium RBG_16_42_24]OGM16081.1 MAG: protein-L-isoaspartate O-methyltransferase [Candidatus Woesebacteria bacterium RBG_19FT_COMBO_42_9]OGM68390.1 MAG: protein-L-isoaspartate O-methyltransferase [Candidatus Woesebacteria bacterium RIFCSPLOWO2_01_FULL_43_11]
MNPRQRMIGEIKEKYLLSAPKVFSAMLKVPREEFVPKEYGDSAYHDGPISIGWGQTISQPYTVAFMTNLLISSFARPRLISLKILEIGTGSGYQAAVLSHLSKHVYTIERIPALAEGARKKLKKLGYQNVEVKVGTGELGWKDKSPFDAILVTAGMEWIPEELFTELKEGGVLVAPVGRGPDKVMTRYKKLKDSKNQKLKKEEHGVFHFVPFVESN